MGPGDIGNVSVGESAGEGLVNAGVTLLVLLGSLFFAAGALAAPDEAALGKAEGYPICPGTGKLTPVGQIIRTGSPSSIVFR
jgi:hypothetical protein